MIFSSLVKTPPHSLAEKNKIKIHIKVTTDNFSIIIKHLANDALLHALLLLKTYQCL